MIGKSIIAGGLGFSVLHIGGSPTEENTETEGLYESIPFKYAPCTCVKIKNRYIRIGQYLLGFVLAIFHLMLRSHSSGKTCVYVFLGPGLLEAVFCTFLRLARVPFVHEINEWWPGNNSASKLVQWFRNGPCLRLSSGTIVISRFIEDRLRMLIKDKNIPNDILRVPALVDSSEVDKCAANGPKFSIKSPYFLWCGDIKGYMRDIRFMIKTLSFALTSGADCRLVLVGSVSSDTEGTIRSFMKDHNVPNDRIIFTGYVSDDDLKALTRQSHALLLPLWSDERSVARFPTKLGDYLLSSRPVITCAIGDLCTFLSDGESAFLCPMADEALFADKICMTLRDPRLADRVGRAGANQAVNALDYRRYSSALARLFIENLR